MPLCLRTFDFQTEEAKSRNVLQLKLLNPSQNETLDAVSNAKTPL